MTLKQQHVVDQLDHFDDKPVIVDGRVFWRVNGRLMPAIAGGAPTDDEKKKREEEERAEREAEADAKLNGAVKNHVERALKKAMGELSKTLGDAFDEKLKALAPAAPIEDDKTGKSKGGEKEDPKLKLALEEIEKLKKSNADAQAKADAAEKRQRTDSTRGSVRAELEALGIKGAKAKAAIAMFEADGMIGYSDDGVPFLTVSRSRAKNAKAEALEFEDFKEGLADWAKTADAAEFLPAPGAKGPTGNAGGRGQDGGNRRVAQNDDAGAQTGGRRAAPRYESPAESEAEAARRTAEDLSRKGIDIDSLLND